MRTAIRSGATWVCVGAATACILVASGIRSQENSAVAEQLKLENSLARLRGGQGVENDCACQNVCLLNPPLVDCGSWWSLCMQMKEPLGKECRWMRSREAKGKAYQCWKSNIFKNCETLGDDAECDEGGGVRTICRCEKQGGYLVCAPAERAGKIKGKADCRHVPR